jgi:DnaJ-class molecular chaperone
MRYHDALRVLNLPVGLTLTEDRVRGAYLNRAHAVHPDLGGTRAAWDELQDAYHTVLEDLKKPRYCGACGGTGQRVVTRRGRLTTIVCDQCNKE